jgi:biopolymer transport protein ExbD
MRLRTGGSRAEIPAAPAAGLALLLFLVAGLSAAFSSQRGLLVRLPGRANRAAPSALADAVFLAVLPDASLNLDSEPVTFETLLSRLEPKIGRNGSRPVVLIVSDDAPYGAMVAVVDLLAGGNSSSGFRARRLLIPTHAEIREWTRALGGDPFGPATGRVGGDLP